MSTLHPVAALEPSADKLAERVEAYRKITVRLIPFLVFLFVLAWLDRVNVGFSKLQMLDDLKFSEAVYGLGAGIFFIGYFLFELPSNLLLTRIGVRRTLARITILWSLTSIAMAFVKTPMQFYILRFLLGVFEAGFFPGVVLYITFWFPAQRRARINGLFMTSFAVAGIIGGPLAGLIMSSMSDVAMAVRGRRDPLDAGRLRRTGLSARTTDQRRLVDRASAPPSPSGHRPFLSFWALSPWFGPAATRIAPANAACIAPSPAYWLRLDWA